MRGLATMSVFGSEVNRSLSPDTWVLLNKLDRLATSSITAGRLGEGSSSANKSSTIPFSLSHQPVDRGSLASADLMMCRSS